MFLVYLFISTWCILFFYLSLNVNSKKQSTCILTTHDFRSLYAIYFRDVNVVTVKILETHNASQDLSYFSDAIAQIIISKTKKKLILWQKYSIKTNITTNNNQPIMGVPESHQVLIDKGTYKKTSEKIKTNSRDKAFAYVILVWNAQNLNFALDQFVDIITYNRGLYLVVFIEQLNDFSAVFRRFWNNLRTFNVMATTLCYIPNRNNVFIYNPFAKIGSTYGFVKNISVDDVLNNPNELFDFMNNFNGFPIHVSLFPRPPTSLDEIPNSLKDSSIYFPLQKLTFGYGGVDGCVVGFLAQKLNFTVVKSEPQNDNKFGTVNRDGSITGSLGQVVYDIVDISANGRFLVPYKTDSIEFTQPVMNDIVCPVVPKSHRVPQWQMIFHGFKGDTWLLITGVSLFSCVFWYFTNCIHNYMKPKHKKVNISISKAFIDVTAVILNMPVILPNTLSQRIFMASLLALNVIINGIFQGTLVRSFSIVFYHPDINTLEELDESGLPIATSLQVFSHDTSSELYKRLSEKVISINSSAMARAAYTRDVVAMERREDANFLIRMNYLSNGHTLLHVAHECPSSYFITYIVPKNSPFLPKFNWILLEFFEAGLINKWYDDFVEAVILENGLPEFESERKPFALRDMQAAFFVLIFGILLSVLVFTGEFVVKKFRKVNK